MPQPQFRITSQETDQHKVAVNLLPCAVHHDGPVDPIQAYWRPTENDGMYAHAVTKELQRKVAHGMMDNEQEKRLLISVGESCREIRSRSLRDTKG